MGRLSRPKSTDINGELLLNGKIYNYTNLGLYRNKLSFLLIKEYFEDLDKSSKDIKKFYWSSKKSPNGPLLSEDKKWYKVIGEFECRIHKDIHGMPSFFEFVILHSSSESEFCQINEQDIRDAKLESILYNSQELPFV